MEFPFTVIESKMASRKEFDLTDGYQPTHALFYIKKGNFDIELNGENQNVCEGDCLILPDYLHFHRKVVQPIEFVFVKFTDNLSCPYSFAVPYGKVAIKDEKRFASSISAIERLLTQDDALSASYRQHLLADILFQLYFEQLTVCSQANEQAIKDNLVEAAVKLITEWLGRKILIQDICKHVGTNASTLNFRFRRAFNMSIGQFITCERMKKARRLLIGTTYSISEIAVRCGFDSVYYFSNAFKKAYGTSPSKYKYGY